MRQIYLCTYSRIDSIVHIIKNYCIEYRCWKYCHSPIIHAVSPSVVVDYDMYLDVSELELDQKWKYNNIVEFWTFHDLLSNQMINYNPNHKKYSSDTNMRTATHQKKSARDNSKDADRVKKVRPSAEEVELSKFSKN